MHPIIKMYKVIFTDIHINFNRHRIDLIYDVQSKSNLV